MIDELLKCRRTSARYGEKRSCLDGFLGDRGPSWSSKIGVGGRSEGQSGNRYNKKGHHDERYNAQEKEKNKRVQRK